VLVLNWRDGGHPEAGGSELYVEQMARGLVAQGAEVTMLSPRYRGALRRETLDGIHHRRLGGRLTIYLLVPLLAIVGRLGRFQLAIEIQNGMPFCASAYLRIPVVVVVHHVHREQWPILFSRPIAQLGWWLESRVAPRVARRSQYVTVSEATREELAGHGVEPARVQVIRNGSPAAEDVVEGRRSAHPCVIALGRLVPHKRVELAIDAVAALAPTIPDLELIVVGDGWWYSHLLDHARAQGVENRVVFTGHVGDAEKHLHLGTAWVNALPSIKEGWGLVVTEAGLHQTPTVAFRAAGGVRESLVDGETGILADHQEGFVAAIERLLRDQELRDEMGRAADKHARSFTWQESQAQFVRLVGEIAQRGRTRSGVRTRRRTRSAARHSAPPPETARPRR
jgi:glycosyltransferase involved in cell wall biosynthesis